MGQLANIDEPTDVLMQRAFMARTSILLHDTVANGKPLSIVALAIDQFRAVNDGFGHAVNDRILKRITPVVPTQLKPGGLIGHLDGKEFAIVVADTDEAVAATVMDELRLTVEHSPRQGMHYTFSTGVEYVMPGDILAATLVRAGAALYLAKGKGCNRIIIASKAHEGDVETHDATTTSKLACWCWNGRHKTPIQFSRKNSLNPPA